MVPFWSVPSHWGLKGKDKDIAYAKYYFSGEELDNKLNNIENEFGSYNYFIRELDIKKKYNRISEIEYYKGIEDINFRFNRITLSEKNGKQLYIDKKYGAISEEEYDYAFLDLEIKNKQTFEYKRALLDLDLKHGKITLKEYDYLINDITNDKNSFEWKKTNLDLQLEYGELNDQQYDKELCTLKGIPYFEVISGKFDKPEEIDIGEGGFSFEFDFNDIFVEGLKKEGWPGNTPYEVVDEYFKEVCKQIAYEEEIFDVPPRPDFLPEGYGDYTKYS